MYLFFFNTALFLGESLTVVLCIPQFQSLATVCHQRKSFQNNKIIINLASFSFSCNIAYDFINTYSIYPIYLVYECFYTKCIWLDGHPFNGEPPLSNGNDEFCASWRFRARVDVARPATLGEYIFGGCSIAFGYFTEIQRRDASFATPFVGE